MNTRTWAAGLLLLAAAFTANAGDKEPGPTVEASVVVNGTIEVDPDGKVAGFALDRPEQLPGHARALVEGAVPEWRFEPTLVDGKPAWVRTPMWIRVVAARAAGHEDAVALRIASASFGEPSAHFDGKRNHPPTFPREAIMRGASGTVNTVLKVDREGNVVDVVVEQVNLRYQGSEREMAKFRGMFEKATMRAARRWTFEAPTGPDALEPFWSVRVPVDFNINSEPQYGSWVLYVPGPLQAAPWLDADEAGRGDAYAAGGIYPVGSGLKLLTPLGARG